MSQGGSLWLETEARQKRRFCCPSAHRPWLPLTMGAPGSTGRGGVPRGRHCLPKRVVCPPRPREGGHGLVVAGLGAVDPRKVPLSSCGLSLWPARLTAPVGATPVLCM